VIEMLLDALRNELHRLEVAAMMPNTRLRVAIVEAAASGLRGATDSIERRVRALLDEAA